MLQAVRLTILAARQRMRPDQVASSQVATVIV